MNTSPSSSESSTRHFPAGLRPFLPLLGLVAGFVVFALWMFQPVWGADTFLFATDDNIGVAVHWHQRLPAAFIAAWQDALLVGMPTMRTFNWTWSMLWLLPAAFYKDWMPAIDCVIGSLFLVLFLRRRGVGWPGCVMGALTAFWLGTNFTLLYAGHTPKFGILMFSAVFLYLYDRALASRHPAWAALAGGAFGMMFLEQADVGLFFAVLLGPYALYAFWARHRFNVATGLRLLVPLLGVALLLAVHPLLGGYRTFVDQDPNAAEKDPQQEWEFLTQWSWPPMETIDFLAPGYTGWRSGEPEGPYWGKMGQSAGWSVSNPRGFRNFKLENHYMGAIPCGFIFLGLWVAVVRRRRGDMASTEVLAWGVLALIAFLLACGKYLPFIYKPFAMLPAVSSVRNPNKFLQILQIIMGILAAYGVDALLDHRRIPWITDLSDRQRRTFLGVVTAFTGLFGLLWLGRLAASSAVVERLTTDGWGAQAEVIAATSSHALAHGVGMAILFAAVAAVFVLPRNPVPRRTCLIVAWTLIAVVAVDAKLLTKHYVIGQDLKPLKENPVAEMLVSRLGHQRAVLPVQQGFYNNWLTDLFPYWGIRSLNTTSAARLPDDYMRFMQNLGGIPTRWWQLGAGEYILAPVQLWQQIQADPHAKDAFEIVYAFNVRQAGPYGVQAVPASQEVPGQHVVLRFKDALPRYSLVSDWRMASFEVALQTLLQPEFDPTKTVLVDERTETALPASSADTGSKGSVDVERYRAEEVSLKVYSDREAILLISERFDPSWHAWMGGEPVEVLRCNGIFQGVKVPPGLHRVRLRYEPPIGTLYVQAIGMAACLLAGGFLAVEKIRAVPAARREAD